MRLLHRRDDQATDQRDADARAAEAQAAEAEAKADTAKGRKDRRRAEERRVDDARSRERDRRTPDDTARDDAPRPRGDDDAPRSRRGPLGARRPEETVETVKDRWDIGSVLAVAAGVALVLVGIVALVRTGIDSTWYDPVVTVVGVDHTAALGAVEVGVGALLVLAGLAHARAVAALVALVAGVAAAVVAIEPDTIDRDVALDRGFATALAVAGVTLALALVMAPRRTVERRIRRRPTVAGSPD
jgi:lysylphosphatidylglycerol synthetase-like protein (DUF2156 family)